MNNNNNSLILKKDNFTQTEILVEKKNLACYDHNLLLQIEQIWKSLLKIDTRGKDLNTLSKHIFKNMLKTRYGLDSKMHLVLSNEIKSLICDQNEEEIYWKNLESIIFNSKESIIQKAFLDKLSIGNWENFCSILIKIFNEVKKNENGQNASYIPELKDEDPNLFGFAICTTDGQFFSYGDSKYGYSIQSCGKPILYSIAVEDCGYDFVHKFVGKEANGMEFNSFSLNKEKKPFNASINAGAIAICALFHQELSPLGRFKLLVEKLKELAGGKKIGFRQSVYLSEKATAHRNFALAYFMASEGSFPESVKIEDALDFYFQLCSLEITAEKLAIVAGTYANYGVCPLTNKRVISKETAKYTMQMLFSSGMYNYSGTWAGTVGLPAKSGVSGSIFIIVPKTLGICIFSPRLDENGNSVRGIEFATKMADHFGWNVFDILYSSNSYQGVAHNRQ